MKKLIGAVMLTGLLFSGLQAQKENQPPKGPHGPQTKDRVVEMKKELNLSDEQAKKIEEVFSQNGKEIDALREKEIKARETSKKEMNTIFEKSEKDIQNILTDEQKAQYKKMQESRKHGDGRMMPPPRPGGQCCCGRMMPPPPHEGMQNGPQGEAPQGAPQGDDMNTPPPDEGK